MAALCPATGRLGQREHAWIALLGCGLPILFVGWSARRRLGGVTGDVMGATVEIAEIATLIGLVCAI